MGNPIPKQKNDISDIRIVKLAQLTIDLMQQHGVNPTPENYAVWYAFARCEDRALNVEINQRINEEIKFTEQTNHYLYQKYVSSRMGGDNQGKSTLQDASHNAQQQLAQVLRKIGEYTGETASHNEALDKHISGLSSDIENRPVQEIVQAIIDRVSLIKDSGDKFTSKLEESKAEIESLKANLAKVTSESQKDFLTGVSNRKALDAYMLEVIPQMKAEKRAVCILMIDIDHFKSFNDNFGHLFGDEVLKIVAKALTDTVKGKDFVARYGGEEFAVVLPDTPLAGAMVVAEIIRRTIAERELKRKDTGERMGAITVSIGVASFHAESDSVASFIQRADAALYVSKKTGRNKVTQEN